MHPSTWLRPLVAPALRLVTPAELCVAAARAVVLAVLAGGAAIAPAQTTTIWDGGGTDWSNSASWSNGVPLSNGVASFAYKATAVPQLSRSVQVGKIELTSKTGDREITTASSNYTLTLNGVGGVGIDDQLNHSLTIDPKVILGGSQTWQATNTSGGSIATVAGVTLGTYTLTLVATNSVNSLTLGGAVTGTGSMIVDGTGTVTFNGTTANTFTGTTTVKGGTLTLAKSANVIAVSGPLVIGDGAGASTVTLNASEQISNTAAVTMTAGGTPTFNLNGNSEAVGSLASTNTAAVVALGAGTLTTGGDNTSTSFAGTISGTGGGLVKTGTGTFTLSGASSYTGNTTINAGTLVVASNNALGTGAGSTTVASGATLGIQGGTAYTTAEAVTISGTGASGRSGAIDNLSGNNSFAGAISLAASSRIGITAGNLTLGGAISLASSATGNGTLTLATPTGSTLTLNGTISDGAPFALSLSQTGSGTVTLAGSNTYSGTTTIGTGGTLQVGAGGTSGSLGTGAVTNNGTLTFNRSDALTVGNVISGTGAVRQAGAGTTTLSATNSYTGGTTVAAGTLKLAATGAAGAAGNTITLSGGTLDLATDSSVNTYNVAVSGSSTILSDKATAGSSGITHTLGSLSIGTQTLTVGAGSNVQANSTDGVTFSQPTTLTGNATFNVLNNTNGGGNSTTTLSLAAVGESGTSRSVTKNGAGTLLYTGNNTYTGVTTVNAGAVIVNSTAQLAGATSGLTMTGGTLTLQNAAQTVASLTGTGGTIVLGTGNSFTVNETASDTYAGALNSDTTSSFIKAGTGTLTLSGNNTLFKGSMSVGSGTLVIGGNASAGGSQASVTVSSGAALALTGNITTTAGSLNLVGTGVSNSGALYNAAGSNTWGGNIALTGNTTIGNTVGSLFLGNESPSYPRTVGGVPNPNPPTDTNTLSLGGNTLTFTGAGTTQVNTRITGTGNVLVDAAGGTVHYYANQNTYTGTTTVKAGTLNVDTTYNTYPGDPTYPNYFGINGPLVIGTGSGSALSAVVRLSSNEVLNFATNVTIGSDGYFDLGNKTQSIGNLTMTGGRIDAGTSGLYLNGDVTTNAIANTTATINGTLSLTIHNGNPGATNRIFNVAHDATNTSDLTINAVVNNGSLTKTGAGTMTLAGDNTYGYGGTTTVQNGILSITNAHSLGQAQGDAATGTTVTSGTTSGTLQLNTSAATTFANEALTLNGAGYNGGGALQNAAGTNTWTSIITLNSDSRIQTTAGQLTITNEIGSSTNANLTVGGAANTIISGPISTGQGGVTKDGTGTLVLSGDNSYQGGTTVSQGILSVQSNHALGAVNGGTTVSSGAALYLDNSSNGGVGLNTLAEPLTIAGTGVANSGALHNQAGNNTFGGTVSFSASSLITANSGTSLNLAGGTYSRAGTSQTLQVGSATYNGDVTISGLVDNGANVGSAAGLVKAGSGALTLTAVGTNTVGTVNLSQGSLAVGNGSATVLNTGSLTTAASTSLLVASSGVLNSTGSITFNGTVDSNSAGTLKITGNSTLTFNQSFNASNLTLELGSASSTVTVYLGNSGTGGITVGTIHITGDTVLDFGNSAGTFLSSANVVVDPGVHVTVQNWISVANSASQSTVWYLRNLSNPTNATLNNSTTLGGTSLVGGTPLDQITFTNYPGQTTTWVSGTQNGWFDHEIRPTPEPSTYGAILISGCLGLFWWSRRRHRRPAAAKVGRC